MTAILNVICPKCSSKLLVPDSPDNRYKTITCPVCGNVDQFTNFRVQEAANTKAPGENTDADGITHFPLDDEFNAGFICVDAIGESFPLKEGRNVIGRKANSSKADIMIPDMSKSMSREHFVVDVVRTPSGAKHYLSLYKQGMVESRVNGRVINFNDKVVISDGDTFSNQSVALVLRLKK